MFYHIIFRISKSKLGLDEIKGFEIEEIIEIPICRMTQAPHEVDQLHGNFFSSFDRAITAASYQKHMNRAGNAMFERDYEKSEQAFKEVKFYRDRYAAMEFFSRGDKHVLP